MQSTLFLIDKQQQGEDGVISFMRYVQVIDRKFEENKRNPINFKLDKYDRLSLN